MSLPLEREYEAWLVRGIEDYFRELSIPATIVAVSPRLERHWPADESLAVKGKVDGLQIKRPIEGRLEWDLSSPSYQRQYMKSRSEIYYALPAFEELALRRVALYHFYFWLPGRWDSRIRWARISSEWVRNQHRTWEWGGFVRQIMECKIGALLGDSTLVQYIGQLQADMRRFAGELSTCT